MNLCDILGTARDVDRAIRCPTWPPNLAWYHGTGNAIRWRNGVSDEEFSPKTGIPVQFSVSDFLRRDFVLHPDVDYHGNPLS